MSQSITCFIPYSSPEVTQKSVDALLACPEIQEVVILSDENPPEALKNYTRAIIDNPVSTATMRYMAGYASTPFVLFVNTATGIIPGQFGVERLLQVASMTGAGMVYADYYEEKNGQVDKHPVIDYQVGSLRDDFDFGPMVLLKQSALRQATDRMPNNYEFAGWYDLRLKISETADLVRVPEFLYTQLHDQANGQGDGHFAYVDPKNRGIQIEYEKAVTEHLKAVGAFLQPPFQTVDTKAGNFPVEASVVIPVMNRQKTIRDAVESVLKQKTSFDFNLIVVDNHSSDGTTEILKEIAGQDNRLIHIIPERKDLGIGGCWSLGVHQESCGRYAVQLDSDDMYKNTNTLQTIVDKFNETGAGMVIGSYQITDFDLNEIPPGIIDHREWTPENGANNALRINGLGAPRAFYTPLVRELNIPNVSYGEDYAVGIAIARNYLIERIYNPIYQCRRWEDNSDASMSIEKANKANTYKDRIRSFELLARKQKNAQ